MLTIEEALEGSTPLARKVAAGGPFASSFELVERMRAIIPTLTEEEKIATLNAHPRIGEDPRRLSAHSLKEQGADPLPELELLNAEYERRFGFRFVLFVNHRPKFAGDRYEPFAEFLGRQFLEHYPQMQSLRIFLRELPFEAHSDKLLSGPLDDDYEIVELHLDRAGVQSLRVGRRNLRLVKLTGSAFKSFARDEFTTLPEVTDRPLYIFLDVHWRYPDGGAAIAGERLVGSGEVRDVVRKTFDDFVSMSIQHLVHEMGKRVLERFPELSEVSFDAQNRLWDTAKVSDRDPKIRVFSDPKPAHGSIGLTLRRDA